MQPVVAEAHRQQRRETLQLRELAAGRLAVQAVRDAHRELAAPPDVEQRLIVGREQVVAAGIDDAREPEPVQLAEELARALHLLGERRLRQPIEQRDDRALPAADRAREPLAVAHERAAGRQVGVAADAELRKSVVGHDDPAVAELHVDGIVRSRRFELGLRRPAALRELQLVPAAGDDEPAARRPARGGALIRASASSQRPRADPVDLGAEGKSRTHGVQVRVDEPRDDRAAAELDDARVGPRKAANLGRAAERQNLAVANRERLAQRRVGIDGDDLAVEQHEVGRLRAAAAPSDAASSTTANDARTSVIRSLPRPCAAVPREPPRRGAASLRATRSR